MGIRVSVRHDDRSVRIDTDAEYDRATLDHLTSVAHALLADCDEPPRFAGASVEFGFQPGDDGGDDAEE